MKTQDPSSFNPALPILSRVSDRRMRELNAGTWIAYLRSPEWAAIQGFMHRAYPSSQLSGSTDDLEIHHVRPCHRTMEKPRDLVVVAASEHRFISGTDKLDKIEWLVEREDDPGWKSVLQDYQAYSASNEVPDLRALIEESNEEHEHASST